MGSGASRAVVVVANDAFIDYFIPFLESFRKHNPALKLIVVPFDDDTARVRLLASVYDFEIYDGSFEKVDRLADMLFGEDDRLRRRLRKLVAFDMELDEFLYTDTDILVGMDLGGFFGHTFDGKTDLVYATDAGDWVYGPGAERYLDVASSARFGTALYVSSRRMATLDGIVVAVLPLKQTFLAVRAEPLFDQPLLNFFVDATHKTARAAQELGVDFVYGDAFLNDVVELRGGKATLEGRPVTLCHWAGPEKFDRDLKLAGLLAPYVARARRRIAHIPEFRDWSPFGSRRTAVAGLVSRAGRLLDRLRRSVDRQGRRQQETPRPAPCEEPAGHDGILPAAVGLWSPRAQLTAAQAEIIGSLIAYRNFSANVLIFGMGYDSPYWTAMNIHGRTLLVEDDGGWADTIEPELKSGSVVRHTYPTTVATSVEPDPARLATYAEPAGLREVAWDVILIDGPAGYEDGKPGRALPIYWAHRYATPRTHIFVDDYDRRLERNHCSAFFGRDRHVVVLPSHDGGQMFWRIGAGLPGAAAAARHQG